MNIPPLDLILNMLRASLPQGVRAPDFDPRRLGFLLALWIALEILAFSLIVHSLGYLATLILALATTLLGLSDIRRLLVFWRGPGVGEARNGLLFDGGLSALGAFLLILPGFVSDLAGLALKSPSIRAGLAHRFSKTDDQRSGGDDSAVIDLTTRDYRYVDPPKRSKRRSRASSAS